MWIPRLFNAFKVATVIAAFIGGFWLDRAVKFRDHRGYERNDAFAEDLVAGVHLDENVGGVVVVPERAQEEVAVHREQGKELEKTDNTAIEGGISGAVQETQSQVVVEVEREIHHSNLDEEEVSLDVDGGTIDEKPNDEEDDRLRSTKSLWRAGSRLGVLIAPSGSVLENARSVYAEISADILVRQIIKTSACYHTTVVPADMYSYKYGE